MINALNEKIHKNSKKLNELSKSKSTIISRLNAAQNIKYTKLRLITYISLWNINVQQGMLNRKAIKISLGPLLSEEKRLLNPTLNILTYKQNSHYLDAKDCKQLFQRCGTKDDIINNRKG